MNFRNVGNRVAVDFDFFNLQISNKEALEILKDQKIRHIDVDICEIAKKLVGIAQWRWASRQWEAPHYFDCSALTKWVYGQMGIWLPRRPQQQFEHCEEHGEIIKLEDSQCGDLLFFSSHTRNGKRVGLHEGNGHVCMLVEKNRVICALKSESVKGIYNIALEDMLAARKLQAVGRVCNYHSLTTLLVPPDREIESSDDIKHVILQCL